jgi:DNA-binding transcriptional LysR family regulator
VRLLDRDTGGVRLTDAGAAFLAEVRLILAHAEQAVAGGAEAAKGRRGRLTVGYFAPIFMGLMPASLKAFREKFPDVEVVLVEMPIVGPARGAGGGDDPDRLHGGGGRRCRAS